MKIRKEFLSDKNEMTLNESCDKIIFDDFNIKSRSIYLILLFFFFFLHKSVRTIVHNSFSDNHIEV